MIKKILFFLNIFFMFSCITNKYLPEHYKEQYVVETDSEEAELIVRYGDIDNLGFGWPPNFDPFSGRSTKVHDFPWKPDENDLFYTDRILINTSYNGNPPNGADGYTTKTSRKKTYPGEIILKFPKPENKVEKVILQIFVDDFQAKIWKAEYQVTIDGKRVYEFEDMINNLEQTGPIGKIINIVIPDRFLPYFSDGTIILNIDDNVTGAGDGYAYDFFRLLINPLVIKHKGSIKGHIYDSKSRKKIPNAVVSVNNKYLKTQSDEDGYFILNDVISGLAVINVFKSGYEEKNITLDVIDDKERKISVYIDPIAEIIEISKKFDKAKKDDVLVFNNIIFYPGSDIIKKESYAVLDEIAKALIKNKQLKIELSGHTNNLGNPDEEILLSKKRAEKAALYLIKKGLNKSRITTKGYGSKKLLINEIIEKNRRVEIKIL